jgi:hypothetical protein
MAQVFSDLLNLDAGSVRPPPLKPAGSYNGLIEGFKLDKSKHEQTPFVRVSIHNITPGENVTPESLLHDDGKGGMVPMDLSKYKPSKDFFLTNNALYRLTDFIKSLGVKVEGRSVAACLSDIKGLPVILDIVQETRTNSQTGETNLVNNVSALKGTANI